MFKVLVWLLPLFLWAGTFVDMQGNSVEIGKIEKIFASSPTILYSLYAVDRSKIAGLNFAFNDNEKRFIDSKVVNLPVIGGWFGKGKTPNSEMVLSVKPDLILLGEHMQHQGIEKIRSSLGGANIPIAYLNSSTLEDIVQSFDYLGRLTGNEKRASDLTSYAQKVLDDADKLRKTITNKPKIYYAQGKNGLLTECDSSLHAELIQLAGGENVHKCVARSAFGMESINFERVLSYNPEVILVYDEDFYSKIYNDSKWKHIDAVRNRRVYLLPKGPFSWFDRPPSFMKIMGLQWLMNLLHSEHYPLDLNAETKRFYKLFLQLDLNSSDLMVILGDR